MGYCKVPLWGGRLCLDSLALMPRFAHLLFSSGGKLFLGYIFSPSGNHLFFFFSSEKVDLDVANGGVRSALNVATSLKRWRL